MKVAKDLKKKFTERKGITLIALVITIIVLLILAGISIMMLTGDNNILRQATNAKTQTIEGTEKDAINVAYHGVLTTNLGHVEEGEAFQTALEDELKKNGQNVEVRNDGKIVEFKDTKNVYILDLAKGTTNGPLKEGTVGYAYATGSIKIGSEFTYSSDNVTQWIVFGEDSNGNILLASKSPVNGKFTLNGGAEAWLKYESYTDETYGLNYACSGYGKTVQGKQIKSRSITLDDINNVTGFSNVLSRMTFDKFKFGTTHGWDGENVKWNPTSVNYYYPCEDESSNTEHPYWRKADVDTLTAEEGKKPAAEFYNNWYYYQKNGDMYKYKYSALSSDTEVSQTISNMEYIGETEEDLYIVASRFVKIRNGFHNAEFGVAVAGSSVVDAQENILCMADNTLHVDINFSVEVPVRPVVVLPSDILVQATNGIYGLVE